MTAPVRRVLGIMLIVAAVGGILFSLIGIGSIWVLKPNVSESIISTFTVLDNTLTTTGGGLVVAEQSLETSISSVGAMRAALGTTADTLNATKPMIETMSRLAGEDLPGTISATQTSLASAKESAQVIDNFLSTLSKIPLIGSWVRYNPELPLNIALDQVSVSMNTLPEALDTIEYSLETSSGNIEIIEADVQLMAADLSEIETSLVDARGVIQEYQTLVSELQIRVKETQTTLPGLINLTAWVLTFALLWAAFGQVGLLLQGWDMAQTAQLAIANETSPE